MSADIDIDFADRDHVLSKIMHIVARQGDKKHNSGVYVQSIPYDPVLQISALDYEQAEARGYFKIDLLNMGVYQLVKNQDHYDKMLELEPNWSLLWQDPDWAHNLVHVGNYVDLLARMKPDSIPRMAAFISIIRPGKAHLQDQPWDRVFASVWDGDDSRGYTFKKSHAVSYARLVALHMNLIDPAHQGD